MTHKEHTDRFMYPILRASKLKDFKQAKDSEKAIINISLPKGNCSTSSIELGTIHKFVFSSKSYLLVVENKRTIMAFDLNSDIIKEFKIDQDLLPLTSIDKHSHMVSVWYCTATGVCFEITEDGLQSTCVLPFIPSAMHVSNGNVFIGKNDGEFAMVRDSQVIFSLNKPQSFLSKYFNFSWFNPKARILDINSYGNYIYFITENSVLFTVDVERKKIISQNTIFDEKITRSLIKVDRQNLVIFISNEKISIIKVFSQQNHDLLPNFEFERSHIVDLGISNNFIIIISSDSGIYNISRYNRDNGEFIASDWLPKDDIEFRNTFGSGSRITPFSIQNRYTDKDINPVAVSVDNRGIPYVTTASSVLILRPMMDYEVAVLKARTSEDLTNVQGVSFALARLLGPQEWSAIDKEIYSGVSPASVFLKASTSLPRDLPPRLPNASQELRSIIEILDLGEFSDNWDNSTSKNPFWGSAVMQIASTGGFLARASLLYSIVYKIQDCESRLVRIVKQYAAIGAILDDGAALSPGLFSEMTFDPDVFPSQVIDQTRRLLVPRYVPEVLLNAGHPRAVVDYLKLSGYESVYTGVALARLGRFKESADFFVSLPHRHRDDLASVYKGALDLFVKQGYNRLTARFAELVYEFDTHSISPLLFKCYITEKDFDAAFVEMQRAPSELLRFDMLPIFIRAIVKSKQTSFFTKRKEEFGRSFTNLAQTLKSYSIGTLPSAAALFQNIEDKTQTAQSLYLYGRILLEVPTENHIRKAAASFALLLAIFPEESAVRDVNNNRILHRDKVERISARLRAALLADDVVAATKLPNTDLLGICLKHSSAEMASFASTACKPQEVADFARRLVEQRAPAGSLRRLLDVDRREWHFCVHSAALRAYLSARTDPPVWLVDQMAERCLLRLFMEAADARAPYAVLDVVLRVREEGRRFPPHFETILRRLGMGDQLLSEVLEQE